jgi:ribosome recycling factor
MALSNSRLEDIRDVVGAIMFVLAGAELPVVYVEVLEFDAIGELESALNEAFIKLLEFAHDHHLRASNQSLDREMRSELQRSLEKIADLVEPSVRTYRTDRGTRRYDRTTGGDAARKVERLPTNRKFQIAPK